ncbi:MAG: hypothetical protein RI894_135 [Bacteroidota bacterium]
MPNPIKALSPFRRFLRLITPDIAEIRYLYIFSFINGLIALSLPLGVQAIMSIIVGGQISSSWVLLIIVIGIGIIANGSLTYIQLYISEILQRKLFARAAFDFAYRIPRLRLEVIEKQFAPELVNRFFDVLTLQKGLPKLLIDFTNALLQIVLGLLLLSVYNPIFIILSAFIVLVLVLIIALTSKRGLDTSIYESKYKYKVVSWLEELARSVHTFKLAGQSNLPTQRTDDLVGNYLTYRKKHFAILMGQFGTFIFFKALTTMALLAIGSYLVINNSINLGQFVAAELIIIMVLNSAEKIIYTMETIYDVLTALDKIGYVTDIPLEEEGKKQFDEYNTAKGLAIRATNIHFRHSDMLQFEELNFKINPGNRVCLTGKNSAGKSVLLQVIAGLYTDYQGVMAYNDIPIKNLNINSLRGYIGNHSDKEDIFEGSFLENMTLGNRDISEDTIKNAAKMLGLTNYIETLPQGFETPFLPAGQGLAQSILQKLLLLRAIVHQPNLLVIDNYDQLAILFEGNDLLELIRQYLQQQCTIIVVSNDRNVIAACEQVFIVANGSLTEQAAS